ncbi:Voltage-dependent calcium channel subunit alpha-2/delta-3 [Lamellibrachia satsuma]|nr:Voltage-dependent calcium channel subunit alpha-2/delta-3 [Lamellibrachia satsuma]
MMRRRRLRQLSGLSDDDDDEDDDNEGDHYYDYEDEDNDTFSLIILLILLIVNIILIFYIIIIKMHDHACKVSTGVQYVNANHEETVLNYLGLRAQGESEYATDIKYRTDIELTRSHQWGVEIGRSSRQRKHTARNEKRMIRICITELTSGLIIVCILHPVFTGFSQSLDGKKFAAVVHSLANDGLGVDEYQKYVDLKVRHEKEDLNGHQLVQSMTTSLSAKFTEWIRAVERLRDVLEGGYSDATARPTLPECCSAPLGEKDVRFKQKVNKEEICAVGDGLKKTSDNYVNRDEVIETMKQNMDTAPSLKWQYFASEQGVLFNYPTVGYCDETYDPRFRPFYVEVASPQPKDLVVVVDTSGSMRTTHKGRSLMEIAINAASTVVDTLGPNDRVSRHVG